MSNYITEIKKNGEIYIVKDVQTDNKMDLINPSGTGTFSINGTASGTDSVSIGTNSTSTKADSYSEGYNTQAIKENAHAEGYGTIASGIASHAEGKNTEASGDYSHAEGELSKATGKWAHAEGYNTLASGQASHSEGSGTIASGGAAHAEGEGSTASGAYSHAEGYYTTASGDSSHAEGQNTVASGNYSHAEGIGTIAASEAQHVQGKYNISDSSGTYMDIVGYGTDNSNRKNISALTSAGDLRLKENVYLECNYNSTGGYCFPLVCTKLLPKTGTNIVIERDGMVETYVGVYDATTNPGGIKVGTGPEAENRGYPIPVRNLSTPNSNNLYRINKPGYIYGFNKATAVSELSNLIEVTNGGSFGYFNKKGKEVYNINGSSDLIGTGATIKVYSSDFIAEEEFIVILFGDMNGDGVISGIDATLLSNIINSPASLDNHNPYDIAKFRAGDLDPDDLLHSNDLSLLNKVIDGKKGIYQTNGTTYTI